MVVVLRHRETKQYYGLHGEGVSRLTLAAQFETIEEAVLFSRQAHLQHMEIVVVHSNGAHKVALPLGTESWTATHWNVPGTAVHSRNKRIPVRPPAPAGLFHPAPQRSRMARVGRHHRRLHP